MVKHSSSEVHAYGFIKDNLKTLGRLGVPE